MVEFADLVEQHNATAFILCGTLLGLPKRLRITIRIGKLIKYFKGWLRECSLIPHTTDVDIGIFHEEHSKFVLCFMFYLTKYHTYLLVFTALSNFIYCKLTK
jgi:hypothetical protein